VSTNVEADDLANKKNMAMTFFESVTIRAIIIFTVLVTTDTLPAS